MSEVEGRPTSTLSTERRYGIAISVALIVGGAWWALTDLTENTRTSEQHYPVQGSALAIDAGSADLEIRSGQVEEITVTQRAERNLFGSEPERRYRNGKLELGGSGCGFLSFGGCDTSYVVVVPPKVKVTAESSSGDLRASDLSGADLESSSGELEVRAIAGDLRLKSSSGDLEAHDLAATTVDADTSSGDVELTFGSAPTDVKVESSSGDVTVKVPSDQPYKVDAETSSGETQVFASDPGSARSIRVATSSGDVDVEHAGN
jgi:Putative adhesin